MHSFQMRSSVLVALQFVLVVAIAVPFDVLAWNVAASIVVAAGMALGMWTLSANRLGNFNIRPEPKVGGTLVTGGPYRYVRHPMYLALLVAMLGFCVGYGTLWRWIALVALAVVLHIKSLVEERELALLHPGYVEYGRTRKRFIPFVW
jgi:protein-S-isoprenylcysteine O-methyltransferase Ste14